MELMWFSERNVYVRAHLPVEVYQSLLVRYDGISRHALAHLRREWELMLRRLETVEGRIS